MRAFLRTSAIVGLGLCFATPAHSQNLARWVFGSGGGASSGGGVNHFGATGTGMAVGLQEDGTIARHGFLPGNRIVDDQPPEFDPDPPNISVSTAAGQCAGVVEIPAIRVTDNQDNDVDIVVTLQTAPPQDLDPEGDEVTLDIGSYDVLVVATDDAGNEARTSFRIDVADGVAPEFLPVPADRTFEATSPAGTVYEFNFQCIDACDPNPVGARAPNILRYPLGVTAVNITCEDAVGNVNRRAVNITIVDTTPPTLVGEVDDVTVDCDGPNGATFAVPRLVWRDNGTSANALDIDLIVDPGPNARNFEDVPAELTLAQGDHVLRFTATDASGNSQIENVTVTIRDGGEPVITIVNAPENGWVNAANAQVVVDVTDGCGAGGDFDVEILPPPANLNQNGNRYTATYSAEGIYELEITAVDGDGDETTDTSVAFGIDRSAPAPVIRVPSQIRVANGQQGTYPMFAIAERLPLDVGGEEDADGVSSGIARIRVVLDPGGDDRLLADVRYDGNGTPVTGDRVESSVGCERLDRQVGGVQIRDGYCTRDTELDLREVPMGVHAIQVTVTDFAGNSANATASFYSGDLHTGTLELLRRVGALINDAQTPANVRISLQFAALALGRARDLSELKSDTDYDSPVFIGAALRGAQDATVKLSEAYALAAGGRADTIYEITNALQRFSASDVELLQAHVLADDRDARPLYLLQSAGTDAGFINAALSEVRQHLAADQWNQAAAAALDGGFFAKNNYSEWMMDYNYSPAPNDFLRVSQEFARGRNLLDAIVEELNVYLTLDVKPAENEARAIRDRLSGVVEALDLLVREGFDGNGLSDEEYLYALLDLRDVANFSTVASNNGAFVRNYQWTMMQVVRFMTQYSQRDAIFFQGGDRQNWPIYELGLSYVDDGVALLDARRVQAVIDLYGTQEDSVCLVIAVYHCDFLNDEGPDDTDEIYPEADTPAFCWNKMYRPSEWANVPAGNLPAACIYDTDGIR